MVKKRVKRVKNRKNVLSYPTSDVANLRLSNGCGTTVPQVIKPALADNSQVALTIDNGSETYPKFENIFIKYRSMDRNISAKAGRHLKGCRNCRKQNNRSRSRRRRKSSRSKDSNFRDDSDGSSDSSSDLRSTSRHVNKYVLSTLAQYTFYSVVNTGVAMDQGASASALCRSFLALFLKLDENSVYSNFLDTWDKAGQKIIVLKGYNHKHLQYLAKEVRHVAVESNTLYRTTGQTRVMLVLTAFGREEDMEEAFDDLCFLH